MRNVRRRPPRLSRDVSSTPLYGEDKRKTARTIGERVSTPLYGEDRRERKKTVKTQKAAKEIMSK